MNGNVKSALSEMLQHLISVLSVTLTDHVIPHRTLIMLLRYQNFMLLCMLYTQFVIYCLAKILLSNCHFSSNVTFIRQVYLSYFPVHRFRYMFHSSTQQL